MNTINVTNNRKAQLFWLSIISFLLALWLGTLMTDSDSIKNFILIITAVIFMSIVFKFPLIGVGFVIVSINIVDLLPAIPIVSSAVPLIGAITLISFFAQRERDHIFELNLTSVETLGLIFILWIFISNPSASIFSVDRSWIITLAQLWLMLWMARHFVRSEQDHLTIMGVIVLGTLGSAIVALQQTGLEIDLVDRATGLSGGPNEIARYCVYGIVILSYFQSRLHKKPGWRLLIFGGISLLVFALTATGSRSGLVMLGVALFFLAKRFLIGQQRTLALWFFIGLGTTWVLNQVVGSALDPVRIMDAVLSGTDTVGLRYRLFQAGWEMWLDHPFSGVGIGQYPLNLLQYWKFSYFGGIHTPHNTYIQVLSETGSVGFIIFIALLVVAVNNFRKNIKMLSGDLSDIFWVWLIILIALFVGFMSKTELISRLLWFLLGISVNRSNDAT